MENEMTSLALPDEQTFRRDIQAINRFQQVVRANMVPGQDYGVIPGTQKPTLLKPGAEKIAKLLGLADLYDIIDRQEEWDKPFFRYLVKCSLTSVASGATISEGLGECNSMESKYRWRWIGERDLPSGVDKSKLVSQERRSKTGGHWMMYRLENEDIFSQVNTILKMAKKRALVDAALSAGRLSNVFTQDLEDGGIIDIPPEPKPDNPTRTPKVKKEGKVETTKDNKTGTAGAETEQEWEGLGEDSAETGGEAPPKSTGQPKIPTIKNIQALYNWVSSHGKKYTRSWVLETIGMTEQEIKEDSEKAHQEIKAIAGWED